MKKGLLVLLTAIFLTACDGRDSGDSRVTNTIAAANPDIGAANLDIAGDISPAGNNSPDVVANTGDNPSSAPPAVAITEELSTDVLLNPPISNVNSSDVNTGQSEVPLRV